MKTYTFLYSMLGTITVQAESLEEAEELAEDMDIDWDESSTEDDGCIEED